MNLDLLFIYSFIYLLVCAPMCIHVYVEARLPHYFLKQGLSLNLKSTYLVMLADQ